jgi:subtilisin family serine protease
MPFKYFSFFVGIAMLLGMGQSYAQDNAPEFLPGALYFKVTSDYQTNLDPTSPDVNIEEDIPFLSPYVATFGVYDVQRSFYFTTTEKLTRVFRVQFESQAQIDGFIAELSTEVDVEYAEKIPLSTTGFTPNDLGSNTTSGQWGLHKIDAQNAWDLADGSGITIGVVDNAFFLSHPDLINKYVSGYDAADNDSDPSAPNTTFTHGTHVAGIAGAETDNAVGVASIGYKANLMPIKATGSSYPHNWITHGYEGIVWAADLGADIINCSWGGSGSSATAANAVAYAASQGALIVAAAGNSGNTSLKYPAAYPNVLSVVSTNINDQKSGFSTYGNWVDICAPGESIRSTLPGGYGQYSGTSMASPMVAGLAALVWSANSSFTRTDVEQCLLNTADNIDAQNPSLIGLIGAGRINARAAVECANACPGMRVFVSPTDDIFTTAALHYEADMSIEASNVIGTGTTVIYDAGEYILLKDGFFVQSDNVDFSAIIDGCGNLLMESAEVMDHDIIPIRVPDQETVPSVAAESLLSAAPNPFVERTTLEYTLPEAAVVQLEMYDQTGRLVRVVQNGVLQDAGTYRIEVPGSALAPGAYHCRLIAGQQVHTLKLIRTGL